MRTDRGEKRALPLLPFGTDLRESGRDDADGTNAGVECGAHRLQNCGRWDADNREVDGVGYIDDRAVSANAGHRLTVTVHRVGGPDELAREDVAEELAADRAPARRRSNDGDRARLEERPQRCDDRGVVACLDA